MSRLLAAFGVVVGALAGPAAAQGPDLAGRQAMLCADDVLAYLTDQPHGAYSPVFHLGLARYFLGCTYPPLPPSVGPILSTMQADIDTIQRYRDELPDAPRHHREAVCYSWWAIYSSTYQWLLYEYGSDIIHGLPEPDTHAAACGTWAEGR